MHTMIDHLWTDIDTATGTLQGLDPSLRSDDAQQRLPQLLTDIQETRRAQYKYLRLEESGDEGAHQASLSINTSNPSCGRKKSGPVPAPWSTPSLQPPTARAITHWFSPPLLSSWPIVIAILVAGIATAAAVFASRRLSYRRPGSRSPTPARYPPATLP